ncbi:MAG TPA: hypothetical protein DEB24_08560 [Coriobacteriia bacterium]|nr:hypothetical protein [Coriobacteriia bacterium]
MKSGELAKLAGVTQRTLRHYRDIGLLKEPQRDGNGYCDYRMQDLARVLRIKNLTALGFSLEKTAQMLANLDDVDSDAAVDYLDNLDCELVKQIELIEQKRNIIAKLKKHPAAVDVPADSARLITRLVNEGHLPEHIGVERGLIALASHLIDEDEMHEIAGLIDVASGEEFRELSSNINKWFFALTPDTPEEEKRNFVQASLNFMDRIIGARDVGLADESSQMASDLLNVYVGESYNAAQAEVLKRIEEEYTARLLSKDGAGD